ncbi:MAG TPA: alpha/beta hydrolase, partial [Sphingomicrobium sp.]|nr:alpha/beta hydrolase [Sphingomicrobium sp.]
IALHVALLRPNRVGALVGIAAAPDFTHWGFEQEETAALRLNGRLERKGQYDGTAAFFTLAFYESAERLMLLHNPIEITCPVRLIHGELDEDVPHEVALRTMNALRSGDVQLNLIKGGGHRLSQPHEIETILRTVINLLERAP